MQEEYGCRVSACFTLEGYSRATDPLITILFRLLKIE